MKKLMFCIAACGFASCGGGGGGGTEVAFGGASCESRVILDQANIGYDSLYNFEAATHRMVSVAISADSSPDSLCSQRLQGADLLPWVRILPTDLSSDGSGPLSFELVAPGGRNAPVLESFSTSDRTAQSIQGSFEYPISVALADDRDITVANADCSVELSGGFCPIASRNEQRNDGMGQLWSTSIAALGSGRFNCKVSLLAGNGEVSDLGSCSGSFSIGDAILVANYYGV